ncbi:MAG: UDP-N-acetylmuramate:L-alanyl-gamma-D-glutamyl-meso-diaminopimelate ligase [Verrucomicrobiales bacterium]|nr:UDP-N-acetylmuramate:L-alanyl-gamma-D-glutamyl-meso-diaminopimelate ligase [Verrucomicrobiales bacterium]|tara:strand:- start:2703 stop:4091 length:1389 start_codon:yes stop_codon:yes gene_type:complete
MIDAARSIHFIGICGTAMASVAAALKERGYTITGSDQGIYPPMSTFLEERDIEASPYSESNLTHKPDLVVIGNAISRGNLEAELTLEQKLPYCSLPELLKHHFLRGKRSLVISGTHGKTTTASLLAWILEHNGLNPSFLIGGIPNNLGQGARFTESDWFVLEGDEYDTAFFDKRSKFVHYLPEAVVINNLEFDHADIFSSLNEIQTAFQRLINIIPRNGLLLANGDESNLKPLININHCPVRRFGLSNACEEQADNLLYDENGSRFRIGKSEFRIPMIGELNVRNALAALLMARYTGLSDSQIQAGFDSFKGIRRRMEIRGEVKGITVIDDFAHHPTAIRETLKALDRRFPNRRIWAIFEPRSNTTRRNHFQTELAAALSLAKYVIVAEVARLDQVPPEERLNPEQLMEDIRSKGAEAYYLPTANDIISHIIPETQYGDILCVLSNGGFDNIHQKLIDELNN